MAYSYLRIYEHVEKCLRERPDLRLLDLKKKLKCSHPTIEKAVLRHSSLSFREFRKRIALQRAISLHRMGKNSRDIALELGYKWPSNFRRFIEKENVDLERESVSS